MKVYCDAGDTLAGSFSQGNVRSDCVVIQEALLVTHGHLSFSFTEDFSYTSAISLQMYKCQTV